jgi:hypothetical protein
MSGYISTAVSHFRTGFREQNVNVYMPASPSRCCHRGRDINLFAAIIRARPLVHTSHQNHFCLSPCPLASSLPFTHHSQHLTNTISSSSLTPSCHDTELDSMPMSMPDRELEEYRGQVQTRIQDLLSGNRPRDPHLSSLSIGRLILEGVIEEVKIYRLGKDEKIEEERTTARQTYRQRHSDGERHRHNHHDSSEYRRRRHKSRSRDESQDRHRHQSRQREGSQRRDRGQQGDVPDPVTEAPQADNPQHIITSSADPTGVLPSPTREQPRSQSRSRHCQRHRNRPRGPDGITPFGELPRKPVGIGLVTHFRSKYRHIKAEHEAGHRERGMLEDTTDGWRGKEKSLREEPAKERERLRMKWSGSKDDGRRKNGHGRRNEGRGRRDDQRRFDRRRNHDRDDDKLLEATEKLMSIMKTRNLNHLTFLMDLPLGQTYFFRPTSNTQLNFQPPHAPLHSAPYENMYHRAPISPNIHVRNATCSVAIYSISVF